MDLFGPSLPVFRAFLAPFFALLIIGTWLLAREVLRPRSALLATFVVATLPIVTNYSRKWDTQFFAAAATPLGLYLALRCLRSPSPRLLLALGLWHSASGSHQDWKPSRCSSSSNVATWSDPVAWKWLWIQSASPSSLINN